MRKQKMFQKQSRNLRKNKYMNKKAHTKLLFLIFTFITSTHLIALNASSDIMRNYDFFDFNKVKTSAGVNVNIEADKNFLVVAHANEETDLSTLKIYEKNQILYVTRDCPKFLFKQCNGEVVIDISVPTLTSVHSSSGSRVFARNISSDEFDLNASSGAEIQIDIECDNLYVESSSGAEIMLEGLCTSTNIESSSGAEVEARKFKTQYLEARASSASEINAKVLSKFTGSSSSGAEINIYGDLLIDINDIKTSSGGEINKKS